jgi:hypothetical protein
MHGINRLDVLAAIEDLKNRTLPAFTGDMGRMVYLASTRDYNTGQYYHAGLAVRFTEEVANIALAACHRELFDKLSVASLENLVNELQNFVPSAGSSLDQLVDTWSKLGSYRMTIPANVDNLAVELFFANIKTALAILAA